MESAAGLQLGFNLDLEVHAAGIRNARGAKHHHSSRLTCVIRMKNLAPWTGGGICEQIDGAVGQL
jgi:hypothetical protein